MRMICALNATRLREGNRCTLRAFVRVIAFVAFRRFWRDTDLAG
jgi:hypothetical protein